MTSASEIPCGGTGQDAETYKEGLAGQLRGLLITGNGTVTDNLTGIDMVEY